MWSFYRSNFIEDTFIKMKRKTHIYIYINIHLFRRDFVDAENKNFIRRIQLVFFIEIIIHTKQDRLFFNVIDPYLPLI